MRQNALNSAILQNRKNGSIFSAMRDLRESDRYIAWKKPQENSDEKFWIPSLSARQFHDTTH